MFFLTCTMRLPESGHGLRLRLVRHQRVRRGGGEGLARQPVPQLCYLRRILHTQKLNRLLQYIGFGSNIRGSESTHDHSEK